MDTLYSHTGKAFTLIVAWVFAQASEFGGIINRGFDQAFSIGLLVAVLIILFKEYKNGQKYNSTRDKEFSDLLKESIETRKDFQKAIEGLTTVVEKITK